LVLSAGAEAEDQSAHVDGSVLAAGVELDQSSQVVLDVVFVLLAGSELQSLQSAAAVPARATATAVLYLILAVVRVFDYYRGTRK
jgi:hypothetical protein